MSNYEDAGFDGREVLILSDGTLVGRDGTPVSVGASSVGRGAGLVEVTDGNGGFIFSPTAAVDTTDAPQPLGIPNPGTGSGGAAASDHVHQMPATSQLSDVQSAPTDGQAYVWNAAAGKFEPAAVVANAPIWMGASNGEITLPRGHMDDSGSYSQTPGSKVLHLTYFVATKSRTVGNVKFGLGSTAAANATLTQVGLFSVNPTTGALTLVASSASPGTALAGGDGQRTIALTASYTLAAGTTYAIGLLQVLSTGTTTGAVLGAWVNDEYLGELPVLCQTISNQTTMPTQITSGLGSTGFAIFYFLTT